VDAGACVQSQRPDRPSLLSAVKIARSIFFLFTLAVFASEPLAWAQSDSPSEYQVKAAFLYNFAKFVEWPADAFPDSTSPFVFGIVGDDPFEGELTGMISEKSLNGRRVVVRRFRRGEDLRQCHVLFISSSEKKFLTLILESVRGSSVLTVADTDGFARQGGIIGLVLEENRVRLEINPQAAEHSHLKISSKLLALARIVGEPGGGRD